MAYPIEDSERALEWYRTQGEFYEAMTKAMLHEAGIGIGMSVLDVGCGAGDVSTIVAKMVGPKGRVLGIDRDDRAVRSARARASMLRLRNVEFLQADARQPSFPDSFDAVVGRFVLMYLEDPATAVGRLKCCVRPNGFLAFLEPDYSGARSLEHLPLFQDVQSKIELVLQLSGADTRMGLKLQKVFIEAGLPRPELRCAAAIGGGPDFAGYKVAAGFVGLLLPIMEKFGVAKAADVDVETLAGRLRAEVVESGGVIVFPSVVAAYSRVT